MDGGSTWPAEAEFLYQHQIMMALHPHVTALGAESFSGDRGLPISEGSQHKTTLPALTRPAEVECLGVIMPRPL